MLQIIPQKNVLLSVIVLRIKKERMMVDLWYHYPRILRQNLYLNIQCYVL